MGDAMRVLGTVTAAGVGAGLALGGAALTGSLGGSTTIQRIDPAAAAAPSSAASPPQPLSVQAIYRLDSPGVVQIARGTPAVAAAARASEELGSGFVIDKAGHIVTSSVVLDGARAVRIGFSGSDRLEATLVGNDPTTDVAVLQVDAHSRSLSPLPLGDSDAVQVGDPVVALGNTVSVARTATVGVVSAIQHGVDAPNGAPAVAHSIQTDAAIGDSNSGGPLVDARGQVIGVSSRAGAVADLPNRAGGGFAIPIDIVKSVVSQLLRTGTVQHPFLGIDAVPVTPALARSFGLPCEYGLIVQTVTRGGAGASAGLRAGRTSVVVAGETYRLGGDIIVAADGVTVTRQSQLREVIQAMRPGERLTLRIWRGAKVKTVHVTLGRAPDRV